MAVALGAVVPKVDAPASVDPGGTAVPDVVVGVGALHGAGIDDEPITGMGVDDVEPLDCVGVDELLVESTGAAAAALVAGAAPQLVTPVVGATLAGAAIAGAVVAGADATGPAVVGAAVSAAAPSVYAARPVASAPSTVAIAAHRCGAAMTDLSPFVLHGKRGNQVPGREY